MEAASKTPLALAAETTDEVRAALDVLTADAPEPDAVAQALERVAKSFEALGDLGELEARVAAEDLGDWHDALQSLARVHAVLTMTFARRKDALRDKLLLARSARRGTDWHGSSADAGVRCDVRG